MVKSKQISSKQTPLYKKIDVNKGTLPPFLKVAINKKVAKKK